MSVPAPLRSIRFRITLVAAIAVAVVLTAAGVLLLAVQQRQLSDSLDASLRRHVDDLVASGIQELADGGERATLPAAAGDELVIQVVAPPGDVRAATANAFGLEPVAADPTGGGDAYTTVSSLPLDDDGYRILSRRVDTRSGPLVVHVADSTDDIDDLVAQLRTAVFWSIPVAVVLLAAVVWWLVGRTLRPVDAIRAEVAALGADQLDRRVPEPHTGDEIDRLARTMNAMLGRLEDADRRQRQFVADASHELRTPLTRMRTELEVDPDAGGRPGASAQEETGRSLLEEIGHLTALVDDLLVLARSDAGRGEPERRPVDLDDLVFQEVDSARRDGSVAGIDVSGVSAAQVAGEPGELRRVVRNLIDNAVRHADSRVSVTLTEQPDGNGGRAVLSISDDGPGVPPERSGAIFERFTRLDDARSRASGGAGLGLAIARDIVVRHGGTLSLDAEYERGARFVVELPAVVVPSAAPQARSEA